MPIKTKTTLVLDEFLRIASVGGLVLTAIVAPNAVQALDKPLQKIAKRIDKSLDQRKIAYYMKRADYVEVAEHEDGTFEIKLTKKGQQRGQRINFDNMTIPRPKKWDNKWRMVAFDIPEENKAYRNALTGKLKELGFFMQQKSLWIHPFDCLNEIALIKHVYPEISDHVILAEISSTDSHNSLVRHFAKLLPL